jgi:hypothetical protein
LSHWRSHAASPANTGTEHQRSSGFFSSKAGLVAIGFVLVAAFLLLSEHRAHALGYLPYLLILACPLMHLFMHGRHSNH